MIARYQTDDLYRISFVVASMALFRGLVSIIIPSYNAEDALADTLASVRNQTYKDLEVILVDDRFKDNTLNIARRHRAEDARIHIISIPNSGVAPARTAGISVSRGEFVSPTATHWARGERGRIETHAERVPASATIVTV